MKKIVDLKIAITGSFGFKDIGDEAMLTEDLNYIISELEIPRKNIFIFGDQPDYVSYYHNHPRENCFSSDILQTEYSRISGKVKIRSKIKQSLKAISTFTKPREISRVCIQVAKSCDVLLVTGGGTINTRDYAGNSLKRIHALVSYFKAQHIPIFMSGQTIGPLGLVDWHDDLARDIINSVDFLSTRDNLYSRRYLDILAVQPKKFIETFDDAYTLPYKEEILPLYVDQFLESKNTFALSITDYTADLPEQRKYIAELCEYFIDNFHVNLVFVSHTPKDFYSFNIIYDMLRNTVKESVLVPDTRLWRDKVLKKLISSCKVAIGGRYHFIVFAGTSNTPFVGMCGNHYSYIKQDGFARVLGLEDYILSEKETWDESVIISRVKSALNLKLDLENKFLRPSVSMQHFGKWLKQKNFDHSY
jgi:polysaccharide pyruvyl transferase WcaK-like protein